MTILGHRCLHFNGIQNKTCKAGIDYMAVRDTSTRPARWPCNDPDAQTTCASMRLVTPEEQQAKDAVIAEMITQYFENLKNDICPFCQTPIKSKRQVGRCVYAVPCNHRLYQGKVDE